MSNQVDDPLLGWLLLLLATGSIGVWFFLIARWRRGPILPFEPRRPVPWHAAWNVLPLAMVALTLASAWTKSSETGDEVERPAASLIDQIAAGSALQMALVYAFLIGVAISSRATPGDLGLPKNSAELARDLRIGFTAWLAAIVPVYTIQFICLKFYGQAEGHQLLNIVREHPDPTTFIVAILVAVVMASLCEEPLFRLVLQGSLEKLEDQLLGWRTAGLPAEAAVVSDGVQSNAFESITASETMGVNISADELRTVEQRDDLAAESAAEQPPTTGLAGLPYGWLPIATSALLFGLAHYGYGPEPFPMFAFGIILGYVYQRTHRILPSIVAHAMFNGTSMFALWRMTSADALP